MNLEISFQTDGAEYKKALWEYAKYRIRSTRYIAIFQLIFIILLYLINRRKHKRFPVSCTYIFSREAINMKVSGLSASISYKMLSEYLSEEAFIVLYINKKPSDHTTNKRKKRKYILPTFMLTKEQREELLSILDFQMNQRKEFDKEEKSAGVGLEMKVDMSSSASKKSALSFLKHEIKNRMKTFAAKILYCIYIIFAILLSLLALNTGESWSKEFVILEMASMVFLFFYPMILAYLGYAFILLLSRRQRIRVITFTNDSIMILENNVNLIIPYHTIVKYIRAEKFILFHYNIHSNNIYKKSKKKKLFIPTPELSATQKDMLSVMLGFIEMDSRLSY